MKKEKANEHLVHFLENTTPYQRLFWLKKAFDFWKILNIARSKKKTYNKLREK